MDWLRASAALAILSFDVDAEAPILVEGRRHAQSPAAMSHQAYGPLIGVPRLLDLLAYYSLPATFFVPGVTAERYPETVERIVAAGHEVGHHGHSHRSPLHIGASGPSTFSPSTDFSTTRPSWTTTGRTCSRPRTGRSPSCRRTGASTTGTSTCTSPTRGAEVGRSSRPRARWRSGARSSTACAATAASSSSRCTRSCPAGRAGWRRCV